MVTITTLASFCPAPPTTNPMYYLSNNARIVNPVPVIEQVSIIASMLLNVVYEGNSQDRFIFSKPLYAQILKEDGLFAVKLNKDIIGYGETQEDAINDLYESVFGAYLLMNEADSDLTSDAIELKEFMVENLREYIKS